MVAGGAGRRRLQSGGAVRSLRCQRARPGKCGGNFPRPSYRTSHWLSGGGPRGLLAPLHKEKFSSVTHKIFKICLM